MLRFADTSARTLLLAGGNYTPLELGEANDYR